MATGEGDGESRARLRSADLSQSQRILGSISTSIFPPPLDILREHSSNRWIFPLPHSRYLISTQISNFQVGLHLEHRQSDDFPSIGGDGVVIFTMVGFRSQGRRSSEVGDPENKAPEAVKMCIVRNISTTPLPTSSKRKKKRKKKKKYQRWTLFLGKKGGMPVLFMRIGFHANHV